MDILREDRNIFCHLPLYLEKSERPNKCPLQRAVCWEVKSVKNALNYTYDLCLCRHDMTHS